MKIKHLVLGDVLKEYNRYTLSINCAPLPLYHDHDYYEFLLVLSGSCTHYYNGQSARLETGDVFFIRPKDIHCCLSLSGDFAVLNIILSVSQIQALQEYLGASFDRERFFTCAEPFHTSIPAHELKNIVNTANQLMIAYSLHQPGSDYHFRVFVMDLFTHTLTPSMKQQYSSNVPVWLNELLTEMIKPEVFCEGMPAVYRLCRKSPEHLSRALKKHFNTTPYVLINELRMDYALHLLLNSELPIIEISNAVGYTNLSSFYHAFKKQNGVSPKQFRLNHARS